MEIDDGDGCRPSDGSELGRRIWERYRSSPGVVDMDGAEEWARAESDSLLSRLPLLVSVRRRWLPEGEAFYAGSSGSDGPALPYVSQTAGREAQAPPASAPRMPRSPIPTRPLVTTDAHPSTVARADARHPVGGAAPTPNSSETAHALVGPVVIQRSRHGQGGAVANRDTSLPAATMYHPDGPGAGTNSGDARIEGDGAPPMRQSGITSSLRAENGSVRMQVRPDTRAARRDALTSGMLPIVVAEAPTARPQRQGGRFMPLVNLARGGAAVAPSAHPSAAPVMPPARSTLQPAGSGARVAPTTAQGAVTPNAGGATRTGAPLPLVLPAALARQTTDAAPDAVTGEGPRPAPASAPATTADAPMSWGNPATLAGGPSQQGVNMDELVDRTMRRLMRALAVEGERRGGGGGLWR